MAEHIYTRTGDAGETGLFGGQRLGKDDLRVEAYGTVDELNAQLGVAIAAQPVWEMRWLALAIQSDLLLLGGDVAMPGESEVVRGRATVKRMTPESVARLEQEIDRLEAELPPLTRFILPGGTAQAAALHLARTVCRRSERLCVALARTDSLNPVVLAYLNRLSDLLFVMARAVNHRAGVPDVEWNPAAPEA